MLVELCYIIRLNALNDKTHKPKSKIRKKNRLYNGYPKSGNKKGVKYGNFCSIHQFLAHLFSDFQTNNAIIALLGVTTISANGDHLQPAFKVSL